MRLNLGSGRYRLLPGYINLDKVNGWLWESGLPDYGDNSIDCVTSSHTLMYVPEEYWTFIHGEVYRVLKANGVWRITEDETFYPSSIKYGGHTGFVTLTSLAHSRQYLEAAGFTVHDMPIDQTLFEDNSILQHNYDGLTTPFFIEGVK